MCDGERDITHASSEATAKRPATEVCTAHTLSLPPPSLSRRLGVLPSVSNHKLDEADAGSCAFGNRQGCCNAQWLTTCSRTYFPGANPCRPRTRPANLVNGRGCYPVKPVTPLPFLRFSRRGRCPGAWRAMEERRRWSAPLSDIDRLGVCFEAPAEEGITLFHCARQHNSQSNAPRPGNLPPAHARFGVQSRGGAQRLLCCAVPAHLKSRQPQPYSVDGRILVY